MEKTKIINVADLEEYKNKPKVGLAKLRLNPTSGLVSLFNNPVFFELVRVYNVALVTSQTTEISVIYELGTSLELPNRFFQSSLNFSCTGYEGPYNSIVPYVDSDRWERNNEHKLRVATITPTADPGIPPILCKEVVRRLTTNKDDDEDGTRKMKQILETSTLPTRAWVNLYPDVLILINIKCTLKIEPLYNSLDVSSLRRAVLEIEGDGIYSLPFLFVDGASVFKWFQKKGWSNRLPVSMLYLNDVSRPPPSEFECEFAYSKAIQNGWKYDTPEEKKKLYEEIDLCKFRGELYTLMPPYFLYWYYPMSDRTNLRIKQVFFTDPNEKLKIASGGVDSETLRAKLTELIDGADKIIYHDGLVLPPDYKGPWQYVEAVDILTHQYYKSVDSFAHQLRNHQIIAANVKRTPLTDLPASVIKQRMKETNQLEAKEKLERDEYKRVDDAIEAQKKVYWAGGKEEPTLTAMPIFAATKRPQLLPEVAKLMCTTTLDDVECCKNMLSLPVIRYPKLYYAGSGRDRPYCGTYYYFDPDSPLYLDLGRVVVFGSKLHALWTFIGDEEHGEKMRQKFEDKGSVYENIVRTNIFKDTDALFEENWGRNWEDKVAAKTEEQQQLIQRDFYGALIPTEEKIPGFTRTLRTTSISPEKALQFENINPLYPSVPSDLLKWDLGSHDYLDQIVCFYGQMLGIDTILLQHEVGQYRAVTEIIDTRPYSSQYLYETTLKTPAFPRSEKFPTIWFTEFGFAWNIPVVLSSDSYNRAKSPTKCSRYRSTKQTEKCKIETRGFTECVPPFTACVKDCLENSSIWILRLLNNLPEQTVLHVYGEKNAYSLTNVQKRSNATNVTQYEGEPVVTLDIYPSYRSSPKQNAELAQKILISLYQKEASTLDSADGSDISLHLILRSMLPLINEEYRKSLREEIKRKQPQFTTTEELSGETKKQIDTMLRQETSRIQAAQNVGRVAVDFPNNAFWQLFREYASVKSNDNGDDINIIVKIPFPMPRRL